MRACGYILQQQGGTRSLPAQMRACGYILQQQGLATTWQYRHGHVDMYRTVALRGQYRLS
jgi:hypothetical protein